MLITAQTFFAVHYFPMAAALGCCFNYQYQAENETSLFDKHIILTVIVFNSTGAPSLWLLYVSIFHRLY
jgi:hypothetical protein